MSRASLTPRLLTKAQAAEYIAVSYSAFEGVCDVRAVSLGDDKRLLRWDRMALDAWIDARGGFGQRSIVEDILKDFKDADDKKVTREHRPRQRA